MNHIISIETCSSKILHFIKTEQKLFLLLADEQVQEFTLTGCCLHPIFPPSLIFLNINIWSCFCQNYPGDNGCKNINLT